MEEITSKGTRVSCVYYQEKCPYKKRLETYLMILVTVYVEPAFTKAEGMWAWISLESYSLFWFLLFHDVVEVMTAVSHNKEQLE